MDTSDAYRLLNIKQDPRNYTRAVQVLKYFNLKEIRLMTNNPRKIAGLRKEGISVTREPLEIVATEGSYSYLETKAKQMGHFFKLFGTDF